MTTLTLSKWGNSTAVRIPNQFLKRLNLEEGSEIEMMMTEQNEILIRPAAQPEDTPEDLRTHLKMLLSRIPPQNRHKEVDFGTEGEELI